MCILIQQMVTRCSGLQPFCATDQETLTIKKCHQIQHDNDDCHQFLLDHPTALIFNRKRLRPKKLGESVTDYNLDITMGSFTWTYILNHHLNTVILQTADLLFLQASLSKQHRFDWIRQIFIKNPLNYSLTIPRFKGEHTTQISKVNIPFNCQLNILYRAWQSGL